MAVWQRGAPVDDVRAAVDEALMVEADEGFAHGEGAGLVHGEVLAAPVDGDAEALHLLEDGSAVVTPPLPDALDEGLAAQLLARAAFLGELALDHHLRGDAGVVGAGNPEGAAAAHAAPAGEDVHLRLVEHVAHVQAARDVGRRQQDGKRRAGGLAVSRSLDRRGGSRVWAGRRDFRGPSSRPNDLQWRWGRRLWAGREAFFLRRAPGRFREKTRETRGFQTLGATFQVSRWRAVVCRRSVGAGDDETKKGHTSKDAALSSWIGRALRTG